MAKPGVISLFRSEGFEERFPGVRTLGKPVDFFVECKSYDLEIPVDRERKKGLDMFEEAILKMVQVRKCPPDKLADILCLKTDLIHFILLKLREGGLLLDNQTVSEKGKKILKLQEEVKSEIKFVQGKLFVVNKTGFILPYIHVGEFGSEQVDGFDSSAITLGYGIAGSTERIRGRRLRGDGKQSDSRIDARVLRKRILLFNKIAEAQYGEGIPLNEEYGLSFSSSENICFHFKAALRDVDMDEVLFSDGFVPNVDGMLDFVQKEDPELLSSLRSGTSGEAGSGRAMTEDQAGKYKEIHRHYQNACRHKLAGTYEEAAVDKRKNINEGKRQIMLECYSMLEWAFYSHIMQNPVSGQMIDLLKAQSVWSNARTLVAFARRIGIRPQVVKRSENLFCHMDSRKISSVYRYKTPQLYACLPLAIVEAKENGSSRIHGLIRRDGSFLEFINLLNEQCGNLRHNSDVDAIGMDVEEAVEKTVRIVQTILPDLVLCPKAQSFSQASGHTAGQMKTHASIEGMACKTEASNASQALLSAQVYLEKAMGFVYFHTMPKGLQNEWIKISPDKTAEQLPQPWEYIMILSRILEAGLLEASKRTASQIYMPWDDALRWSAERYGKELPETLRSVRHHNDKKAVQHLSSSLGAAAIVYYANEDEQAVGRLNEAGFIPVMDKVLRLRGHGTLGVFNETAASLNQLREDVMRLCKIIGGFYD